MDLFVYGTLRNSELMAAVAGGVALASEGAELPGFAVHPVPDDVVPMIVADAGAVSHGRVWRGMSAEQKVRLDLYEGAFGYRLTEVEIVVDGREGVAHVYLPPSDASIGQGDWSLAAWEADHLRPALLAAEELFRLDPLPSPEVLRAGWAMIEKRAWAQLRAESTDAAATVRRQPAAHDVRIVEPTTLHGEFFRLSGVTISYEQFNGTRSDLLRREVFLGIDAAILLPYDAATDRVLLVEQIRMGPLLRGDPNPWCLEPIAGMVDARETPLEAGEREAMEEADLSLTATERMMAFYPSPGSSTDYFNCYLGLADLGETRSYFGGLDSEAEDLRLHVLPFEQALGLIETGEVNAGPLIAMLYWLDRNRARLRGHA